LPDMRFAPPNPIRIADRSSGLNAPSIRSYNERLILSLLLKNNGISRLDLGEKTGLSAQTISVLVRSLEQEGLVSRGEAQRGRVGAPTTPLSLNPNGAFAVGISFGAAAFDVVLVDLTGAVRHHVAQPYGGRRKAMSCLNAQVEEAISKIPRDGAARLAGIGLAVPEESKLGDDVVDVLGRDLSAAQKRIETAFDQPVFMQDEITAAASGEAFFGTSSARSDFLFIYLGSYVYSRLILDHRIFRGSSKVALAPGLLKLQEALNPEALVDLEANPNRKVLRKLELWAEEVHGSITASISHGCSTLCNGDHFQQTIDARQCGTVAVLGT
jgi:DNA-binding Lrp family transcriptional regulator